MNLKEIIALPDDNGIVEISGGYACVSCPLPKISAFVVGNVLLVQCQQFRGYESVSAQLLEGSAPSSSLSSHIQGCIFPIVHRVRHLSIEKKSGAPREMLPEESQELQESQRTRSARMGDNSHLCCGLPNYVPLSRQRHKDDRNNNRYMSYRDSTIRTCPLRNPYIGEVTYE